MLSSGPEDLRQSRFASDGRELVVASHLDGRPFVLDHDRSLEPLTIGPRLGMRYISISPDGRLLATGTWRGEGVRIWDLADGTRVHELAIDKSASVGFSPDGKWLVTSAAEHIIWRTDTWQPAARFERPAYTSIPGPIAIVKKNRNCKCCSIWANFAGEPHPRALARVAGGL